MKNKTSLSTRASSKPVTNRFDSEFELIEILDHILNQSENQWDREFCVGIKMNLTHEHRLSPKQIHHCNWMIEKYEGLGLI